MILAHNILVNAVQFKCIPLPFNTPLPDWDKLEIMEHSNEIAPAFLDRVKRKIQYTLFRQKWNIGITKHSVTEVSGLEGLAKQRRSLTNLIWMEERKDAFFADPFLMQSVENKESVLLFYEYFCWQIKKGRIDSVTFANGRYGKPSIALETGHHLSYPFIFPRDLERRILPEHSASKNLSFYKIDGQGVACGKNTIGDYLELIDPTIVFWQSRYWMFATQLGKYENRDLHIYFADNINGPWKMHKNNPVKQDYSNSRPAGQFIFYNKSLFRPAQDCTANYGAAININKIIRLTETEFLEEPVCEVRPEFGSRYDYGMHTISSFGSYTALDGARCESVIHHSLDRYGRYFRTRAKND